MPDSSFDTVLIANRGEIALRAVEVCRALGLRTVAVYSTADRGAIHVEKADRAVCIGPAPASKSYLSAASLLHVAQGTGCGAVYPGYGFLSENAAFARRCGEEGIKFVGPAADTIADMGDKAKAREKAAALGVPVVPGSDGVFTKAEPARREAERIGWPLLLKARAGGGGRGMRVVETPAAFDKAFGQASREAESAFSDGSMYLERFFPRIRHIEVQVLGDGRGNAIAYHERDCSVQRRHQKLVEESPSPAVGTALRNRIVESALSLARGIRYEGAGTVEFILEPDTDEFFFIEMNTRIQVEHPVTEMRADVDLVAAQFRVAAGEGLDAFARDDAAQHGHAIEFRINAENWQRDFAPSPGRIERWRSPGGEGVRLDTAMGEGLTVPPYYDSMIAKLIVHGTDRDDAVRRAAVALSAFECDGIATTIDFHRWLLEQPDYIHGRVDTRWIERDAASVEPRRNLA